VFFYTQALWHPGKEAIVIQTYQQSTQNLKHLLPSTNEVVIFQNPTFNKWIDLPTFSRWMDLPTFDKSINLQPSTNGSLKCTSMSMDFLSFP
jgi:hypothetical protein